MLPTVGWRKKMNLPDQASSTLEITADDIDNAAAEYTCQVTVTNGGVVSAPFMPNAGSDLVVFGKCCYIYFDMVQSMLNNELNKHHLIIFRC